MSKNKLVQHHEKCAESHDGLSKGFTALAVHHKALGDHRQEAGDEAAAEMHADCAKAFEKVASHHADLSEAHGAMAEHAKKAIEDALGKTIAPGGARGVTSDAPASARVRLVNRPGNPERRENEREKVLGENLDPDVEGIDPELADLVKANA
jgi:hypothetical protein